MSDVTLQGVSKQRGNTVALDRVTLDFAPREVTAILGASGSGKTTLLHLINGLLRPDTGRVDVFGTPLDYANLPSVRRRMGYAVQSVGLFPHLSVLDNLTLGARLFGVGRESMLARMETLFALMQLDPELLTRYPHELSGGQRQRCGICRAMMLEPQLLLLDEPFSGVDPITRDRIHDEFLALMQSEPTTTILVTHDVGEAVRLASRIVVLEQGRVQQHGAVDELRYRPATENVARLFAKVAT